MAKNYSEFELKLENKDTLNILVNLSMCTWREYDLLEITKLNETTFLQLKKKVIMDEEPIGFKKVVYSMQSDTINLEKMMSNFDINYQEKISSPFFIITNPKEQDTITLRTTGLGNRGDNIRLYHQILSKLYPKEMEKYQHELITIPPELKENLNNPTQ